jgi:uncharacterized membrane protein YhiD involved in acid resistance
MKWVSFGLILERMTMIEILTAVGGVIILVVTFFIKHLQKKVKKQETEIKVLKEEKNIEEAKSEALVEKVAVEKEIDQKEEKQKDEIKEGKDAKEIIYTINEHIADFNTQ